MSLFCSSCGTDMLSRLPRTLSCARRCAMACLLSITWLRVVSSALSLFFHARYCWSSALYAACFCPTHCSNGCRFACATLMRCASYDTAFCLSCATLILCLTAGESVGWIVRICFSSCLRLAASLASFAASAAAAAAAFLAAAACSAASACAVSCLACWCASFCTSACCLRLRGGIFVGAVGEGLGAMGVTRGCGAELSSMMKSVTAPTVKAAMSSTTMYTGIRLNHP
mmetsp:Transcript_46489/g.110067  ORF Transcript_46489/g.110067 Transcript_46489/m.110067 type:complete len:228 (-) Transcript_46489:371-1054(-)